MSFFSDKKIPTFVVLALLLIGSIAYFYKPNLEMDSGTIQNGIYENIKLKEAYTDNGQLKVFALAKNNELKNLKTIEGDSVPEFDSVVIGSREAEMMKEEKLFNKSTDEIRDLFGLDLKVEGVLTVTNTLADDFHFVGYSTFREIDGNEGRLFVKLNDEGAPKLFYSLEDLKNIPANITLREGEISDYGEIHTIAGRKYYPLIIGYDEAKMMKEENLFSKPGDIIKGLFGKNFIVVGVIEKTNTSLDMAHIIPLKENDLKEK